MKLRVVTAVLVVLGLGAGLGVVPAEADGGAYGGGGAGSGSVEARGLTVEHQVNPLGVDEAAPRLGWTLGARGRQGQGAAAQSAYEIAVSSTQGGRADVWDSGRVASSRSFDVDYAGRALSPRTRYYWRVRVWDGAHRVSRWSAPAWFETAFLTPGQFQGQWIGSPSKPATTTLTGADWIWYPEGKPADSAPAATRYFRRSFDLPAGTAVTSAQFEITADDSFVLSVNGKEIARSPQVADSWSTATLVDIGPELRPGRNVIAVQATNSLPGPAGLIGKLHVVPGTGDPLDLVTDTGWKAADSAADGWQQPDFDDTAWPAALTAAHYGDAPWYSSVNVPSPPEPLLRKDFTAGRRIASARAYVAGLGYYKLYLNGQRVGNHELDPGFTVYDKTVLYATYDVTKQLRSGGGNTVGVSLGRGYYAMTKPDEWNSSPWHSEPKLKLELDITYTDGSTQRVTSDDSWRAADGPTRTESVLYGETYDARLDRAGWNSPGYDASDWRPAIGVDAPAGTLRAQSFPPIEVTGTLPVTAVTAPAAGTKVYDVGTPTAGWADVAMSGPAGTVVHIAYGEKLRADGTVDNAGLQSYAYTLKGGNSESYRPSYSYDGFRYVQIDAPAGVTVTSVKAERVHTAVAATGDFSSSSDLLNRYQAAQADTTLNNLHSIPTDTPMYEKRPYDADAHLTADSAIANFDMENFYENWMRAHRDDQNADGTLGHTVPGTVGAKAVNDPVWSASFVLINWDLYWYYGDIRPLRDNYAAMKRWTDHYEDTIAATGGIYTGFSYGDWVAPGAAFPPEGTRLAGTAYINETAAMMAKIARALGHTDDAAHFAALATRTADAINATFYDPQAKAYYDDKAAGYRQTSNLLPLSLGIVPAADRAAVLARLADDIRTRGDHLNTGALGTKLILPVLTDGGEGDLAYQVATNPTYPGWGYWFQGLGATTMWEEWQDTSRSHDHAFLGTVADWLYQRVAGIRPAAPGYTKVRIQPSPVGDLTHAAAHVTTPLGRVTSSWTRAHGRLTLRVTIPVGATADVLVPAPHGTWTTHHVGAGSHVFHGTA
ncbi:alpha-L-rhamnosidase [Actinacidiphila alni]|uniref:alpha-L-rhamnosidase n=1 Tax=Actinacidiphila alni TaxID=380248 RepID=A0A1I1ZLX1_9ACTN|nr:family 78 glycoside hydrolase catalytic domain [Actinacidiphila alni]SFE32824.1 alpha-L-rhamnosidase [Actinacidiphila alni]